MKRIVQFVLTFIFGACLLTSCDGQYVGEWKMEKRVEDYGWEEVSIQMNLLSNGQGYMSIKKSSSDGYNETCTFSWTRSQGGIDLEGTYVRIEGYKNEPETGLLKMRFVLTKNDNGDEILRQETVDNYHYISNRIPIELTRPNATPSGESAEDAYAEELIDYVEPAEAVEAADAPADATIVP